MPETVVVDQLAVDVVEVSETEVVVTETPVPEVVAVGVAGPQGPPGSGSAYQHLQATPAATWYVEHGLGRWPVPALIVDDELVLGDITYQGATAVLVTFPAPTTGRLILA